MKNENQIEALKKLGLNEQEIADVLDCDRRIDHDEKLFDLSPEKEKISKSARQVAREPKAKTDPTVYKFDKRTRKPNEDKRFLVDFLSNAITQVSAEIIEISNPEREFLFNYNGTKYKIVLSAPRS